MLPCTRSPRRFGSVAPGRLLINPWSPQSVGLVAAWPYFDFPYTLQQPDIVRGVNPLVNDSNVKWTGGGGSPGPCYLEDDTRNGFASCTTIYDFPALNSSFSIGVWTFIKAASGKQTIFSYGNSSTPKGASLAHNGPNCGVYNVSNGNTVVEATDFTVTEVWHHYLYSWDGTTSRLYFDGQQANSTSTAPENTALTGLNLGKNMHPSFTEIIGPGTMFSDFRIYSIAVSPAVVFQMFDRATRNDLYLGWKRHRNFWLDVSAPAQPLPPGAVLMSVP